MAVRVLNVAEKPSVAKNVAGILSQNRYQTREGRSRYNKIFEFEYTIGTQRCMMRMTSVTGHLMELDFHDQYRRWHSCDPARLYDAPVHKFVPQDKLDIKRTLEEEARQCQWLVLWLDCDREGENIAFEVIDVCHAVNPRLNIFRAHFSSYIDREIHHAAQNLKVPDQRLADAVDARQEIDLRIGASFTRFQTMLLRDAFLFPFTDDERKLILSYGPCQFPTLGFVVERYWEIQAHVPEEFWTINCSHTSDDGTATFNWIRGRLFDYAAAVVIYELCVNEPTATVTKITHEEKRKYPPYPLSTVELQKRGSRYFGLTPENIMKVAEELYQTGFISYPRTETDAFSPNTDLQAIAREQQQHPVWGAYANRLLNLQENLWRNPSNGGHDDKAHPPIHPTKFSNGESNWSSAHERVYELVVRHFLACVSQPALGAQTSVEIDIAGESFVARGLAIIAKNYLEVYRFDSWGGSTIPVYDQGQQFVPTRLTLDSSFTRPPPLLTEADLLELMFQAGIGTDATMHDHIKKLLDRCYVSKDANRRLSPTNLGEALVMGYDAMGYEPWKPYLRAAMEFDMKAVSDGNKTKTQVLGSCLQEMKTIFDDTKVKKQNLFEAMELFFERSQRAVPEQQSTGEMVSRCQLCNDADMMLKKKPDGKFMVGCQQFPRCRNVVWLPGSIAEASVTGQTCNTCGPGVFLKIRFKFRRLEIPAQYATEHLGCIGGCDDILKELMEICGTGPRNPATAPARGRQAVQPSGRARNPGPTVCQHCRQAGHSSANCPSNNTNQRRSQGRGHGRRSTGRGAVNVVCETCQNTLELQTANTENNRGRKFYSCRGCNFFKWEDSIQSTTTAPTRNQATGRGRGTGTSRGGRQSNRAGNRRDSRNETTFVSATGEEARRCFICQDPSHFASSCPNRGR